MSYTVSDFYMTFKDKVKLIAGMGGLSRQVSDAGILDYELVPSLKDKYSHSNFADNQFVVASLLFAKDNPYMIVEAVKHLVSKGASGLAIRNVFKLPISDAVIRFADSRNFPIFLIEANASELSFENIIFAIRSQMIAQESDSRMMNILDRIIRKNLTESELLEDVFDINPSFENQYCIYSYTFTDDMPDLIKNEYISKYISSSYFTYSDFISKYRNSIILVKSGDRISPKSSRDMADEFIKISGIDSSSVITGVSDFHNTLTDFRYALNESIHAVKYAKLMDKNTQFYSELGAYRLVFGFCDSPEMKKFSHQIIDSVESYDLEGNTNLLDTLLTYIRNDSSITRTAEAMNQHEHTIRYRLNRIYSLTGLNPKSFADMEQLSLAAKIHMVSQL